MFGSVLKALNLAGSLNWPLLINGTPLASLSALFVLLTAMFAWLAALLASLKDPLASLTTLFASLPALPIVF